MNTSHTTLDEDTLEPPPNHALALLLFIVKTLLIAAAVLSLAWILVTVKFN